MQRLQDGRLRKGMDGNMEYDVKAEARKQYFKYFKIWFIVAGVLLVIGLTILITRLFVGGGERTNQNAPAERVYDYAEVLTEEEEQNLREYIAEMEGEIQADIVLVTIREPMEADGVTWESAMRDYADDFYLQNQYGYEKVHGSGMLLLDNWYEGQGGSWLTTCGEVYEKFGDYEINEVVDAVYYGLDDGAYEAYRAYVEMAGIMMGGHSSGGSVLFVLGSIVISAVVALIYALVHLHQAPAKDTTQATTYVAGGRPVFNVQRDDFIRKSVVTRRIQKSSSGSGGSSGGRGGSHSRSGVSLGGGGRRR